MKKNSLYKYLIFGFAIGFILNLAGKTLEDYQHNIPFFQAISSFKHFIIPIFFGSISSIFAFFFWKYKFNQTKAKIEYTNNLHALIDVNSSLISTIDLDSVLQIIIDESTHLTNLDTGAIYLFESEKLYLGATTPSLPSEFPELLRYDLITNHPHIHNTLNSKQPVIIPDVASEILTEAEATVIKTRGLRSILYIPLIIENRPVGTIILGTINNLRSFSEHEIELYQTFSGQAALAIENSRLFKKSKIIADELRQQNEEFYSLNEELSESNQRIQSINYELMRAKEKAEESDLLKSSFLRNISHEVRTPLNTITGFSNLITYPNQSPEKLAKFSEIIIESSNKLIEIITDVIEISQIHANQTKITTSEFDIISLLDKMCQSFENQAKIKNIEIVFSFNIPQKSYIIVSDKDKIERIFVHLIDNAIKFTIKGSVEITCELQNEILNINIVDTGIGISSEMQSVIFEPFRQVETGTVRNFGGNGLGLAIVNAYTKLLNGSISLKSELNKGTAIEISIPVSGKKIHVDQKEKNHYKISINTILIAEDEYGNYLYLLEILDEYGFEILYTENGQKALDIARTNKSIDLILMDIKMPIMDGHTAAKLIKEFRPELPIVAQTAFALESEKENFLGIFDDYLTKPIDTNELKQLLMKYSGN